MCPYSSMSFFIALMSDVCISLCLLLVGDGAKKHQCKLQEHFSHSIFTPDLYDKQTAISVGISGYWR